MSRWLVVGEGPSEIGTAADRQRFLALLLQVLADDAGPALVAAVGCAEWAPVELPEPSYMRTSELKDARVPPPQPKGVALAAARARRAADIRQCDAIVFLIDNDHASREKGKTRRDLVCEELGKGPLPHAAGVAKETLEAWIIADEQVLLPVRIVLTKQPEDIWGDRHDPSGEHPKHVLCRALRKARVHYHDVLGAWSLVRAARRAPNLCVFCAAIVELMRDPALCRPKAWGPTDEPPLPPSEGPFPS